MRPGGIMGLCSVLWCFVGESEFVGVLEPFDASSFLHLPAFHMGGSGQMVISNRHRLWKVYILNNHLGAADEVIADW